MFEKDALLTFHGGSKCPQVLAFMFIFLFVGIFKIAAFKI